MHLISHVRSQLYDPVVGNKIVRAYKLFHVVDLCKNKFSTGVYGPYHSIFWFQTSKSIQLPTQFQMTFFFFTFLGAPFDYHGIQTSF
jgi:hypothetical protein